MFASRAVRAVWIFPGPELSTNRIITDLSIYASEHWSSSPSLAVNAGTSALRGGRLSRDSAAVPAAF